MRVLIIGAGAVGYHLASLLTDETQSVTIIDPDPARVARAADNLDVLAILGSGADLPTLERAEIGRMDLVAAVSGVEEVNLLACVFASRYGVKVKVARVRDSAPFRENGRVPPEAVGVDLFISPEQECAQEIHRLLLTPAATDLAEFAEGRVQLVGTRIQADSPFQGRSIMEIDQELKEHRFVLAAIHREGETRIPTGPTRIEPGDKIFILAPSEDVALIPLLSGETAPQLRRVMIAGGSDEAVHLVHLLRRSHVQCTLLERNVVRSRELAELLPGALVLHGDATDLDLLEMEGVEGVDGFVALTDRDEVNMLIALLAKSLKARRVIPLVHKAQYKNLVERVGLDAAVSPRISAANAIRRFIRSARITSVATVGDSRAEVFEAEIGVGSRLADTLVRDVSFPEGSLLGVIVRGSVIILPRGGDRIRAGDRVILFALPDAVPAVEKLLR